MKYSIFKKLILGLFIGTALLGSCTKDFEELNTDPNNPINVAAINIFTNAEQSMTARQMGGWIQHTYLGVWCQQWCKVQYIDEDRYMPRDMSGEFQSSYINELKNLAIVIKQAEEKGDLGLAAAAKILKAYSFMYVTDVWGDIPYSEALQGFDAAAGIMKPKYDSQSSIYESMFAQLEEANQTLAAAEDNFGSGDLIYGGDPALWRKFANTLKLRLLNRAAGTPWSFTYNMAGGSTVTTNPGPAAMANADTRIAAILSNPSQYPIFESNDDNALISYPGLPYRNPIFNTLYTRTDQGISETMVDWLKVRNDPRIHVYGQPTPNSIAVTEKVLPFDTLSYKGFQNGRKITAASFPTISLLGTSIAYDEQAPLYVLCYDEMLFTIAEHYKRVGNDAAAKSAYEDGISASMERWGVNDGGLVYPSWFAKSSGNVVTGKLGSPVSYTGYLTGPLVAWGGTDAHKYQLICEQRWAAMFGQGVQAFSEVRRTGFPERIFEYELEGAYYPNLGLPVRLQYALSEDTYNTNNVSEARKTQNIEAINEGMFSTNGTTAQVWWNTRKNPIPTVTDVH